MALTSPINLNITDRLEKDKEFRRRFFRGQAQDEIAMSIRGLREKRKMRQVELGKESNMKQSAISRIEQADYSAWSFTVLFRIADALDAKLKVVLEPAENVITRYKEREKENTTPSGEKQYGAMHSAVALEDKLNIKKDPSSSTSGKFFQREKNMVDARTQM